jgi:Tol biopolymer transport system component
MGPRYIPRNLLLLSAVLSALQAAALPSLAQQPAASEAEVRRISLGDSLSVNSMAVSPNGRWIVASLRDASGSSNLWVVPVQGGEPIRLTSGPYREGGAQWFPSGDRILFLSNRAGRVAAMTLSFDASRGRAAGLPVQLTLEPFRASGPALRISPDGNWIVYVQEGTNRIKAVPIAGGEARLIAEGDAVPGSVTWSADGDHILFTQIDRDSGEQVIMRAPAAGGVPEQVYRAARFGGFTPGGKYMLLWEAADLGSPTLTVELADFEGRVLARYSVGWNTAPPSVAVSPDGRYLVGRESNATTSLRVGSTSGGPLMTLTELHDSQDWPIGWTADGSAVVIGRKVSGYLYSILVAPVAGGDPRAIPLPEGASWGIGVLGEHATYNMRMPGSDEWRRVAMSLTTGQTREITSKSGIAGGTSISGAGGTFGVSGPEFIYAETHGDRLELRASTLAGPARLVRTFPLSIRGTTLFGVHGDRAAYCAAVGDSTALMVTDGPTAASRVIAMLPTQPPNCEVTISWSHDGRLIATHYGESQILVADAAQDGTSAKLRILDTGMPSWRDAIWLPDDSGITIMGQDGAESQVLLVSLDHGRAPISLTSKDRSRKPIHSLSPDGQFVAYGAAIPVDDVIVVLESPDFKAIGKFEPDTGSHHE